MKKILYALLALVLVVSTACNKTNTQVSQEYTVLKTISQNGQIYNFAYDTAKGCVTMTSNEQTNYSILIFVNKDGAITSIYEIESGLQNTSFNESRDGYPITTYNDAGGIESVEYDELKVTYTYNNYVDNKLTDISFVEWSDYHGWDYDNIHTFSVDKNDSLVTVLDYTQTTYSGFRMFNNFAWIYSMVDALDATYSN